MKEFSINWRQRLRQVDFILAGASVCMALYGLVVIYSATRTYDSLQYVIIQASAILLGIAGMLVVSLTDLDRFVRRFRIPLFCLACVMLVLTLLFGTGDGNRSWIRFSFMPIGIQPSEFVKILFILTFAYHLSATAEKRNRPLTQLKLCLHAGLIMCLVILQGDLGSALVFLFIFLAMLYSAGTSLWYFAGLTVAVAAASPLLWKCLNTYQQKRILVGFQPELDPLGYGYQVIRSKYAISSGGFWGAGYLQGATSQNPTPGALPAKHTDMIFAVMAEEFGFIGVMLYLALLILLVLRMLLLARRLHGQMGGYICVGAAAVIIFQALENIGMCLGMLPVIGITLPFMSYGGSSVFSLFLLIGVVLGSSNRSPGQTVLSLV